MKKWMIAVAILLAIGAWYLPYALEPLFNKVEPHQAYPVSAQAKALHAQIPLMDWHADTLLWQRDVLDHSDKGHVDVPRLQQGGFAFQAFTVVTKSPSGQNYERNDANSDRITAIAIVERWPVASWTSLFERALYQAQKLTTAIDDSNTSLVWLRHKADVQTVLQRRAGGEPVLGALLGLEGAHALEGRIEHVQHLYDAGYRMIGLQHFFDNELGGSLHGESQAGLSEFGRAVIKELDRLQIIIDVAHSSEAVVADVLDLTTRPIVVSHTGFKGLCNTPRNISDSLMQRIAASGGLIAVGYWPAAVCDTSPIGIARMIQYGINLVGAEHVALGSDFDGAVSTALDSSEVVAITQALIDLGVPEVHIRKVMGENAVIFVQEMLPN